MYKVNKVIFLVMNSLRDEVGHVCDDGNSLSIQWEKKWPAWQQDAIFDFD